eukprot:TRINITY_DN5575_c0_g1_i2.p1 TRINITY_DN5575_c0_g1~~TRINITY_DN5575_c0_g1_i2.p1  ORF type:complete len:341 (-),score=59.39 TRINITY_DN5575_c0_g1_i2:51-1073(-)
MSGPPKKKRKTKRAHSRLPKGGVPQKDPFIEMLQQTTVKECVIEKENFIVCYDVFSVQETLKLLSCHRILSLPVLDAKNDSFLGFFDVIDAVCHCVKVIIEDEDMIELTPYEAISRRGDIFLKQSVSDVMNLSTVNPNCQVQESSSLFQAIGLFQKGIHRVAVLSGSSVVNILTQSDVIRFLISKETSFPDFFQKSVKQLSLCGPRPSITVRTDDPALKALLIIDEYKISAVGVVDEEGKLIGNFSASDIKGAVTTDDDDGAEPLGAILLPVSSFLKQGGMTLPVPMACKEDSTFDFVILKLASSRLHRIWVMDDSDHPIGLISLTDIMVNLISQFQERK